MTLILPSHPLTPSRHPISLPCSQFYSYRTITGETATLPDLINEIVPIAQSESFRWLCSLSKGILSDDGMKPETQLQWAKQLFSAEWCGKLETTMRDDGADAGAVFHKRVIWLVLQLAVISCRNKPADLANDEVAKRLARACFMANDLLTGIEAEWQASLPEGDTVEWMIATPRTYTRLCYVTSRLRVAWACGTFLGGGGKYREVPS